MHFTYQIIKLTTTKVESTYLGLLANNAQRICPVAGLERMTTGSAVSALPYLATQVDKGCEVKRIMIRKSCVSHDGIYLEH